MFKKIHPITGKTEKIYSKLAWADLEDELKAINNFRGNIKRLCLERHIDVTNPLVEGVNLYEENHLTKLKRVIHYTKLTKEMYEFLCGINAGILFVTEEME